MRPMIACRNCQYYRDDWGSSCVRPEMMRPDPIEGELPSNPLINRMSAGPCGLGARYFEMRKPWWEVLFRG